MKTIKITLFLLLTSIYGFSQYMFDVRGYNKRPVVKGELIQAKALYDFIPGYPKNWITDYVSVEILSTVNGEIVKAKSSGSILSSEQKNILSHADLSSEIEINIQHKYKNSATEIPEVRTANILLTVVPEVQAEYIGGNIPMRKYLMINAMDKISDSVAKDLKPTKMLFTIDEKGTVVDIEVVESSGEKEVDNLIQKALRNMPNWKPAENEKGQKVKQNFEFVAATGGC